MLDWIEGELVDIQTKADGIVSAIDAAWPDLDGFERIKWGIVRAMARAVSWAAGQGLDAIAGG